jgi:hypothetical protein
MMRERFVALLQAWIGVLFCVAACGLFAIAMALDNYLFAVINLVLFFVNVRLAYVNFSIADKERES